MIRQRLTTIWSLKRRDEVAVRIYYSVQSAARCRLIRLECVEEFD